MNLGYMQTDPREQLARVHTFCIKRLQGEEEIDFTITVKEYFTPKDPAMPFLAQADKQINQRVAPYTPTGWGKTLEEALSTCIRELNRFPYYAEESQNATA